jgi:hypothetical protein
MRLQARSDHIGVSDDSFVPSILPKIETGIRLLRPRLLEIAVGGLLALWWLKVFGLWVTSLQWAATLGLSRP